MWHECAPAARARVRRAVRAFVTGRAGEDKTWRALRRALDGGPLWGCVRAALRLLDRAAADKAHQPQSPSAALERRMRGLRLAGGAP